MAALVDRINSGLAELRHRDQSLSVNDWADYFTFGGNTYPVVQTTMGTVDREQVGFTSVAGFKGSGPIFSLVLARLQVFSQVRFQWTRFAGSQPTELFGTPELGVLERPWHGGTTSDLLARMEVHASVAGCAYVTRPKRDRLSLLRPDRVIIIMGSETDAEDPSEAPDAEIIGYVHETSRGKMTFYTDPRQVAYYAPIPDPDYRFLGMSWITPVIRDLQADTLATEHKARFFVNSATPNLAIKFDASIAIEKVKQFKELLESEHKGAFNAWKTLYLGGGADPVTVGNSFKDMDYAVIQGRAESRLASAAGVPPSWVGFAEGLSGSSLNAGNFNSARRRFSDGTMIHLWTSAATSLEVLLNRPQGATLWYDPRVPFMREDAGDLAAIQQNQAQTIVALVRDGFTPESAVAAVTKNDFSLLVHSGKVSVQLQEPGAGQAAGEQVPKVSAPDGARSKRHTPGGHPHNQQDHAGGGAVGLAKAAAKTAVDALTGQAALAVPPLDLARMGDDPRTAALWFRTGDNSLDTRDGLPGFVSLNRHMREGGIDPEMDARVADIDSAMRDSVLPQAIEVLRGLEYGSLGEPGTLRGVEFSDKAFASATTDPDHARGFGIAVVRMRVPAGVSAIRMADRDSDLAESEILLDRDLRYLIVGEEIEKNERGEIERHLIDVEVRP